MALEVKEKRVMLQMKWEALPIHIRLRSLGFIYQQTFSLVNVKVKWVKDKVLDDVVAREKNLKAVYELKDRICWNPHGCLSITQLSQHPGRLALDVKITSFLRRYPTIFEEFFVGGRSLPWFRLTEEASFLHHEECSCIEMERPHLVGSLQKLLMLTKDRVLPLQTIQQLKWDMGLEEYDYALHYPHLFQTIHLEDGREALKLLCWDDRLAVSALMQANNVLAKDNDSPCLVRDVSDSVQELAFPVKFTRGFGLKKKCMSWLREWQTLPYTSPYANPSHLDPRTDVSEKRIVGVFHELLHLTIQRKTERKNLSNLRSPLQLPQKFTKVFGRHPGIFYLSLKGNTQTVVLREAYDGCALVHNNQLVDFRNKFVEMMKIGFLNRSRGLYKKDANNIRNCLHEPKASSL